MSREEKIAAQQRLAERCGSSDELGIMQQRGADPTRGT